MLGELKGTKMTDRDPLYQYLECLICRRGLTVGQVASRVGIPEKVLCAMVGGRPIDWLEKQGFDPVQVLGKIAHVCAPEGKLRSTLADMEWYLGERAASDEAKVALKLARPSVALDGRW